MTKKTFFFVVAILLMTACPIHVTAQDADSTRLRPSFGLDYIGELQTDFKYTKFVNLLELHAEVPLSQKISFSASTLSLATTNEDMLFLNLQGYSNIDAWQIPFTLTVAGFTWRVNDHHSVFAGIRRIDEDYFCSDGLSLFTNTSCGGFPTVVNNLVTPTFPLASMGIHYAYESERWGIQASVYDGTGSWELKGRNNVFRVCPKSDGIFALGQVEYRHNDSHYFLGASVHDMYVWGEGERKLRPAAYGYAEQALSDRLTLLAAYSHAFSEDEPFRNFCAIGGTYTCKRVECGVFSDYTSLIGVDEWATEFNCKVTLTDYLSVQPVFHLIITDSKTNCAGLLRMNVSL